MSPEPTATTTVTLTVDGKEVTVPAGTLIIRAAEQLGVEIPRFCDHPLLDPAGACRQCYVEVEGQRKLITSCTTPVADGMVVRTQNTGGEAREAQVANLEFLLLNHPLDCPVCDRGGECPLQDQALEFGPGVSRFVEAKRTYPKPIELSPLVGLDRERCVLCARCTRFCDEISGDRQIELYSRGARQQVAIAAGESFDSPFSGNTVQICPVGALTATPYRFAARPFDLKHVDTVCTHCSAGCNLRVDVRRGEVVRQLARDNEAVNEAWVCDKGRFAFRYVDADTRVTTPLLRDRGLEPVSFGEVYAWIAERAEPGKVGFITGGRLADEDAYALSKLARTVFSTNDLDHRRSGGSGGGEAERLAAAGAYDDVTYDVVERAKVIVVMGLDTEQEVPILHLRIRKAVRRHGAKVFVVHPRATRLFDVAQHVACRPGEEAGALISDLELVSAVTEAGADAVVVSGTGFDGVADVARRLASDTGARFAYVPRRAGDPGTLRAGVHPSLLPGGRHLGDATERSEVERVWNVSVATEPGRDTRAILEAAAARELSMLVLVGVDPLRDFLDADLARRALENCDAVVVQGLELGDLEDYADAFLPAAAFVEKDAHVTTWEGRGQRLRPVRPPAGSSRPDWAIFAGLADVMGSSLGFSAGAAGLDELREELGSLLAPHEVSPAIDALEDQPLPGGGVALLTYPLLVDEGRLSAGAEELKSAQERPAFVELHPDDAREGGLENGDRAVVTTAAGEVTLPVRVSKHIVRGAAFVPFNSAGFAANTLLSGSLVTGATIAAEGAGSDEDGQGAEA